MARWKSTEHDLKDLINKLTGFREREDNFNLCLQFATSNVKYHRFLDVDSHKITAVLKGTINKFLIHSQDKKANALRKLSDEFLAAPVFEGRDTGKSDTHYALLSLLLNLSNSPLLHEYVEQPRLPKVEAPKDTFDWTAYLLEGEEEQSRLYISDIESEDDWIDEDDDEDEENSPRGGNPNTSEDTAPPPFPDVSLSTIQPDESTLVAMDNTPPVETGFDWLTRNVVVQYWCGQSADDTDSHFSNLNRDWESYKERTHPLYTKRKQTIITETPLIREILWMLGGVADLFLFIYNGHRFLVREDVVLSHLTDNSLEASLREFTEHAAYIHDLLKFEQEVIDQSCCYGDSNGSSSGRGICQTLEAFSQVVARCIKSLRQELTTIEKIVIKQEETFTLAMLHTRLKPWLPKVKVIHSIYERGVKEAEWLPGNYQKASQLLSVLYDAVLEHDAMGTLTSEMMNMLLPMWIETCKPYLDIIDDWVTKGNLPDPMEEFIVKRNENVRSLDESFWETAFTIHIPSDKSLMEESVSRQTGSRSLDSSQIKGMISHWAPQFLQPILLEVVLAGKSMEMFQGLGRLRDVVGKKDDIFYKATPLYDTFLESLENLLNSETSDTEDTQVVDSTLDTTIFTQQIEDQMNIRGTYDRLLRINFDTVFTACVNKISPDSVNTKDASNSCRALKVTGNGLQPLSIMLQECLYPHIRQQYSKICTRLVIILKEEYHLMEYLASMRHFFLMEAGDTMFEFYSPIFDKIRLHEHWRDASSVNLTLQEALQTYFPDEVNRLTIEINPLPTSSEPNPINITDCMKLQYKVPWPVDVVINTKCQNIYNQVFSFLLQIKRAKYCLDELRFFDLEKEDILQSKSRDEELLALDEELPSSARVHRVHVLRMRLLFFVNSLHNYIMTRILHSTGLEFQTELQKAEDLDQIIKIHNDYIHKIHERCLLHSKVKFLKEAVMKVLNLILTFHNLWDRGIHHISIKTIQEIEVEFSRCIQFLASFLNNVIKRGSFPHLESLAFALITSTEHVTRLRPH
ncbi:gamma-tubulin complex component 5-like isoform X1 [Mizuhopecten yessoensis]|uniref:gamma-tubulin complex component 5-like isoform X1 n=1 Tax=Mizuhopecten yessoensis TaxID=6573 RepID=UPI000B45BE51|nr:gamma-tubulin complex component 5-like isoform X1 [Mizuhopecten yessoensis]